MIKRWAVAPLCEAGDFEKNVILDREGNFETFDAVLESVHAWMYQNLVSCGDGPKDGDKLVLKIGFDDPETVDIYYTLVYEEVHDFDLRLEHEFRVGGPPGDPRRNPW